MVADQIALLVSDEREEFLAAAVDGDLISTRTRQVFQQPRGGAVASYSAQVRQTDGEVVSETLAACTGDLPAGALTLDDGRQRVAVWRYPNDPDLPGLAAANDARRVAQLMGELGLGDGSVTIGVRAYRPRRRAVVEVARGSGRLFVKALRPSKVEALHDRHRLLIASGVPAPHSLGWTDDGLLVLQALPGITLRDAIRTDRPLPSAESIVELLDRLPIELAVGTPRQSWLDRVGHHAAVAGLIAPDRAKRLTDLAGVIAAEAGRGPIVSTHGDFYEAQILVDRAETSTISGLLDVDGAGPGDRLDDLGCLLGHLSVLAAVDRRHARRINAVGAEYLAAFQRSVDPADLRYRTAAVVVSLIAGPHRVQSPNWLATTHQLIELAESWVASARRARRRHSPGNETHLIGRSSSSHGPIAH